MEREMTLPPQESSRSSTGLDAMVERGSGGRKSLRKNLAAQIAVGLVLGAVVGHFYPAFAQDMSPLSVAFLKLIKAVVGLVIFCTIVTGIANIGAHSGLGRIGLKAIVYFEVVTTFAMVVGLLIVNLVKPGAGLNVDLKTLDASAIAGITQKAEHHTAISWLMTIIPDTFLSAFTNGNILPVLLVALFVGCALLQMGPRAKPFVESMERASEVIFRIVNMIMKAAPLAVFGAIAFTVGKYGIASVLPLAKFLALFYGACLAFIVIVFGLICAVVRINVWQLVRFLRVELMLAFATASSESVLPNLMQKLEELGVRKHIVGFVVPTGFSFNLDGSSMYFIMAIVFVAQACGIELTLMQELSLILIFMVTSKGIAGVAGAGFVTLAATLTIYPVVPVAGIVLLLGIDRIMDAMRTVTNLLGNAVATCFIAKWENAVDEEQMKLALENK